MALSDTWLKSVAGKSIESILEKTDRDGLSVRVSKKGKVTFQLRFMFSGKQQRVDVGTYPLISLKTAREISLKYRAEIERGNDPRITKKFERDKNTHAITLSELFYKWYELYCVDNKTIHHEIKRSFELHIFPKLGKYPVNRLTADDWMLHLEDLKKTYPAIAERILINAKQMLSWSLRRRLIETNELLSISTKRDLGITKKAKARYLSHDEIKMLYVAMDGSRTMAKNKILIKLCLIYGCRNGELRVAKKSDFDFDAMLWTVPPENHKTGKSTGKPLIRPIIPTTQELINEAFRLSPSEYLFTNPGTLNCMTRSTPLSLPYGIMQWLRKHVGYEMAHWSIHDLRKTARTNFSSLAPPHIAEIMLGHRLPGEWQTYDQHNYTDEQRECLELWCVRINEIVR